MYRILFRLFLKRLDPEFAHHLGALLIKVLAIVLPSPRKSKTILIGGMQFENRIGMAAGFDKNAEMILGLYKLGFGHVEVGTVTPRPQPGNPKPRLFRLINSKSLINRMGFNNDGAEDIAGRIKALRASGASLPIIGINIGKNRETQPDKAVNDYTMCAKVLSPLADYVAVNVSSPNTPGLRDLQQVESLRPILKAVIDNSSGKPVFVKISPDLIDEDVLAISKVVQDLGLAGVIAANTTTSREGVVDKNTNEVGGLSGPSLSKRAEEILVLLRAALPNKVLISVGGVQSAADVERRLRLGANLVQGYTGFVYAGPGFAKELRRGESRATESKTDR